MPAYWIASIWKIGRLSILRGLDLRSRFRKSLALLAKARHDLKEGADNSPGIGWQDAAIRHIDLAI